MVPGSNPGVPTNFDGFRLADMAEPLSVVEEADEDAAPRTPSAIWVALTPLLPWLVALPGGRWALPLLAPLTVYPAFVQRVRERRYGAAWGLAMSWAALLSFGIVVLVIVRPRLAGEGILHGLDYRGEMFTWIVTGTGKEVTPSRFVPEHLLHLGAFLALTVVSAGYLGLVLGAFLTGYMSYFVGSFALASGRPLLGSLAAWVPWSVIRVMAFVLLGALLARPLLVQRQWPVQRWLRLRRNDPSTTPSLTDGPPPLFGRREGWLFALALAGIAADLALKTLLAPAWGRLLLDLTR